MNIDRFIREQQTSDKQDIKRNLMEEGYNEFDAEEIAEAIECAVCDYLSGYYGNGDNVAFRLYDYDDFLNEWIDSLLSMLQTSEYKRGWEDVFNSLSSDEQRRFIFWQFVAHSDHLFSNNGTKARSGKSDERHYDRCLFWILEVIS